MMDINVNSGIAEFGQKELILLWILFGFLP